MCKRVGEYASGDKVRIRSWDDLRSEFEIEPGVIKCGIACYGEGLKRHCGKVFTLKSKDHVGCWEVWEMWRMHLSPMLFEDFDSERIQELSEDGFMALLNEGGV